MSSTSSMSSTSFVKKIFRRFVRDERAAIAMTVSQMFLGGVSLGIAMFRGTEVYTAYHHETLVGQANFGSSKLAADHARSANIVVNNNVVMASIMGPRFGVEADNITMDANAEIACPTCPKSPTCKVCIQYKANKPRAMAKLTWVRAKQQMLWGALGSHSGMVDQLASMSAGNLITGDIAKMDSAVKISFDDPSRMGGSIWGGSNAGVACKLAMKDTLPSPVTGHAFPLLISPNLLEGLPKTLVQAMPRMICAVMGAAQNAMSGGGGGGGGGADDGPPKLGEIRSVAEKTRDDCRRFEDDMRCAISSARGGGGVGCAASEGFSSAPEISDLTETRGKVEFSKDVKEYVQCEAMTPSSGPRDLSAGGFTYRSKGNIVTCTFDRDKCQDKELEKNSDKYLRDKLGLPKMITNLAQSLGGSETRKPSMGGSSPKNFCACASTQKQVDETMIQISDAVRKIASFGQADPSEALRKQRDYKSCAKWYFPDRKGKFASTPEDEQPFVGAWKWSMVNQCGGGQ